MTTTKVQCPVCRQHEFTCANSYEICPVCDWENEEYQMKYPDEEEGPNGMSLNQAKEAYRQRLANTA